MADRSLRTTSTTKRRRNRLVCAAATAILIATSLPIIPVAAAGATAFVTAESDGSPNVVPTITEQPVVDIWQPPSGGGFVPDQGGVRIEQPARQAPVKCDRAACPPLRIRDGRRQPRRHLHGRVQFGARPLPG